MVDWEEYVKEVVSLVLVCGSFDYIWCYWFVYEYGNCKRLFWLFFFWDGVIVGIDCWFWGWCCVWSVWFW